VPFSFVRSRQRAHLLAALAGIVAIATGASVGILGLLDERATDGVRLAFAQRPTADRGLLLSLPLGDHPDSQDADVRAAIDRDFGTSDAPIDVTRVVDARLRLTRGTGGGAGRDVRLATMPDLHARVTIVDGAFPADASEAIVQADAAEDLDILPGDVVQLSGQTFTVSGTWRVTDPFDPRWLGDPLYLDGHTETDAAALLTDEAIWADIPTDVDAKWILLPDPELLSISDLTTIPRAWSSIRSSWRGEVDDLNALRRTGGFVAAAGDLTGLVDGLRAVEPVALLLLGAVGGITLAAFARLLALARLEETTLLWSRGASTAALTGHVAAEGAVMATLGATIGTVGALVVLAFVNQTTASAALATVTLATAAPGVIAIAMTVGLLSLGTLRAVRALARLDRSAQRSTRALLGGGAVALVVGAAALSIWQLRLYGSPVTPTADGGQATDPIAVVAPALAIAALVLAALLALPLVARGAERRATRSGVTTLVAARSLARRITLALAPTLVIGLAVAALVLAAGYATTWRSSFDTTSRLATGADVHLSTPQTFSAETIADLDDIPAVDGIAPLEVDTLALGGDGGDVLAVRPDALSLLAADVPGAADFAATADDLRTDLPGLVVEAGTEQVRLETQLLGFERAPEVTLWVQDAYGLLRAVTLDSPTTLTDPQVPAGNPAQTTSTAVYTAGLAAAIRDAPGPSLVVAVDVRIDPADLTGSFPLFTLSTWQAGSSSDSIAGQWIPSALSLTEFAPTAAPDGLGFFVGDDTTGARLVPGFGGRAEDTVRPPVVVTAALADRYGFEPGSVVSFYLESARSQIDGVVAAVVPVIPNVPSEFALALDLGVLEHFQLKTGSPPPGPGDLWIGTDDADATIAAATGIVGPGARIDRADNPTSRTILGSAATALWATALACLALGVIAIAAATRQQHRSRRGDVAVLRALGLAAGQQGRLRGAEYLGWIGYGLVAGLLAGAATVLLTVAPLARAAVPDAHAALGTDVGVDILGLVAGLALLAAGVIVIVAIAVQAVARDATRALPEGTR
jgi:hypothetical protein